MSSTGQATSSSSNNQLIIDAALAEYTKITGIDLSEDPFSAMLEQSNSPEAILVLLQERQKTFKTYRDRNRRLISCLSPAVTIIHAFSGILGEAVSLVSVTYHSVNLLTWPRQIPFSPAKAVFTSIDVLLNVRPLNAHFNRVLCNKRLCQAASGVTSSYNALLELFGRLGNFLQRLEIYTRIPPTTTMTDIVIKIMVEVLSVLALTTKQIKQGRLSRCTITHNSHGSMCRRIIFQKAA
jgi:fungal STAND N-terminal Goodbye domain